MDKGRNDRVDVSYNRKDTMAERTEEILKQLDNARVLFRDDKRDEAQKVITGLIDSLTDDELCQEDDRYLYFDFKTAMEEGIYRNENAPEKEIRKTLLPISNIYVLSGSIAMDQEDYGLALERLGEAMDWNPISPEIAFEYAETVKRMGSVDQFLELTRRIFPHIYTSRQLAQAYRNVAYYYEAKEQNKLAASSLVLSLGLCRNEAADRELGILSQMIPEDQRTIDLDELQAQYEKDDIPFGPDEEVLKLAQATGNYYYSRGEEQPAFYFLSVVYDLTKDEELKKTLDKLAEKINNREDNKD